MEEKAVRGGVPGFGNVRDAEGLSLFVSWCMIPPPPISNICRPQDQVDGLREIRYISKNFEEDLLQVFFIKL